MFARRVSIGFVVACFFACASHKAEVAPSSGIDSSAIQNEKPVFKSHAAVVSDSVKKHVQDSLRGEALRKDGVQEWGSRVRSTVEPYWVLPKVLVKHKYRSVARIRARRNGEVLNITWIEKSRSIVFNNLAAKALKKVKHLPPFPAMVLDSVLEIQYEFVTPGVSPPRRKLEVRKTEAAEEERSKPD